MFPSSDLPSRSGLAQVVTRAAVDGAFRRRLLDDPRAAVREELGIDLDDSVRLRFVEKDAGVDLMVVLPDPVGDASLIDENYLDVVLGGLAPGHWDPWPRA